MNRRLNQNRTQAAPIRRLSGIRAWRRMLDRMIWFWLRAGISRDELSEYFERCLQRHRRVSPLPVSTPKDLEFQRILTFWRMEPDYLDEAGRPRSVPIGGEAVSFAGLVTRALPNSSPDRALKHLLKWGLVEILSNNQVALKHSVQLPTGTNQGEILAHTISGFAAMLETSFRNFRKPYAPRLFQRMAFAERFDLSKLPEYQAFLQQSAQEFALKHDAWLMQHEIDPNKDPHARAGHVGVGIFGFYDDQSTGKGTDK